MSTSTTLPDLRESYPPHAPHAVPEQKTGFLGLIPGILLLFVVGYAGKFVEYAINAYTKAHHITFPNIEYVLWAIVFGIVIANTVGLPRLFRPGVATYEFWLKAGIILLGARFLLGDVLKLGGISLVLVAIAFVLSLAFMTWLGRAFNLGPKLTTLLAVGSSVCGVSAIIATQGAIDADEQDTSTAIAAILALGALSLFTFPFIGHALHMSDHAYGIWAGLAVDNTAEATAAGALYSDAAGKFAVLAKTCRNALIGFVVLGYAIQWARKGPRQRRQRGPAPAQGRLPLEEVPQVRPRLPSHLAPGHTRHARPEAHPPPQPVRQARLQQGPALPPSQPQPLGLPAHLRRSRFEDEPAGFVQAGGEAIPGGGAGGSGHRRDYPRPRPGGGPLLPPVERT